jgi:SAM-dependent methyltransferase
VWSRRSDGVSMIDMPHPSWNDSYASGESLPWDTGTPDPLLVEVIESRAIAPERTLEIGCGTGTNAIFLAQHGFDVLGIDISEVAVARARAKAQGPCRFAFRGLFGSSRSASRYPVRPRASRLPVRQGGTET